MKVAQKLYCGGVFTYQAGDEINGNGNLLILGFGGKDVLLEQDIYSTLRNSYPEADIVLCSTSGEIYDDTVLDDTVTIVIIEFEDTLVKTVSLNIKDELNSFEAGKTLFDKLNDAGLSYVMVISDGGLVNGSELVRGIQQANTSNIPVTGGMAGDGDKFNYTVVGCNEKPKKGNIVAVGFYGKSLKVGHASLGGWEIFGPEKKGDPFGFKPAL